MSRREAGWPTDSAGAVLWAARIPWQLQLAAASSTSLQCVGSLRAPVRHQHTGPGSSELV